MPSLYDHIQQAQSQFVPQFVGSNYKELDDAASTLDSRYRANKDYSDKIAIMLANEQYLQNDQHIKDNLAKNLYSSIDKISKSPQNFENSSAAVSQLARDHYTNQARIAALNNYQKAQEVKKQQTMLGADFMNFGDNPENFSTVDPNTGEIRTLNPAVEKKADYSSKMQQLLGKVADDGYFIGPSGEKQTFDDTERYLIKTGQVNKISKDKLNNLVEGLLPSYKASGEGAQDIRRLTKLEGLSSDPIKVKTAKGFRETTPIDEDIRQRFRAIAAPQAFSDTRQQVQDFGLSAAERRRQAQAEVSDYWTGTIPGSVTANTSFVPTPIVAEDDGVTISEGGKYYQYLSKKDNTPLKKDANPLLTGFGDAEAVDYLNKNYNKVEIDPKQAEAKMNEMYNKAVAQNPNAFKDYNDFKEAYKSASKNHASITPTGSTLGPDQAKNYDEYINRISPTTRLYFKDGNNSVQNLEQLAEKIGTSPSNIELKAISTIYDSPRADLPGGYVEAKIEVKGDSKVKEHPTTVFIPLNDQFTALAEPIDHLYKNSFYAGKDVYTMEHPYFPETMSNGTQSLGFYTTTTVLPKSQQRDGKPGFKTTVHPVVKILNGSGGYDVIPQRDQNGNDLEMPIGIWKQEMIKSLSPQFKKALNSGQTFNAKDVKDSGLEY